MYEFPSVTSTMQGIFSILISGLSFFADNTLSIVDESKSTFLPLRSHSLYRSNLTCSKANSPALLTIKQFTSVRKQSLSFIN